MSWNLFGHEWAARLLQEHLQHGRFRHAYLFTGPAGVGRRTLALRFAQAVNCPQPPAPGVPCQSCRTCRQIEAMQHPDLAVVQAEQVGATLKVDQVRELLHSLSLAPYAARYRVALLLRFEEAHNAAANALLKTLEEPPDKVILLLTADSPDSLLPTITSRCDVLRLRPASRQALADWLREHKGLEQEEALTLAHLAGGRAGLALRLLADRKSQQVHIQRLLELLTANRVQRFAFAEPAARERGAARSLLQTWLMFWRDVLLVSTSSRVPLTYLDFETQIVALAGQLPAGAAQRLLQSHERSLDLLDRNINVRLLLESLLLDLPRLPVST